MKAIAVKCESNLPDPKSKQLAPGMGESDYRR